MPNLLREEIGPAVERELESARFIDVHTHLFQPSLGRLGLWGIDDLLTYHYLEAELFRNSDIRPDVYWSLPKEEKANAIWRALFVENLPLSEATRGVVAVMNAFGLATDAEDLTRAREFFAAQNLDEHIDRVFEIAGISEAVMTNDPLDPLEEVQWRMDMEKDPRFHAALRIDTILSAWPDRWNSSVPELRKFLHVWCGRMKPVYMAASLPDSFLYPDVESPRGMLLKEAILPACNAFDIPLSLMIGVRRQVNPAIRLAGDAAGRTDLRSLENLCREFPSNRFLVSVLSRENQHELCVYARKFSNLLPFGCWWFLNNPSIVEEITRERIEMLGLSFIPQHSDARILEQAIYKWRNTRRTLAPILAHSYSLLLEDGRPITREQVKADVERLFRTNFLSFCGLEPTRQ